MSANTNPHNQHAQGSNQANAAMQQEVARLVVDALLKCGLDPSQCQLAPPTTPSPKQEQAAAPVSKSTVSVLGKVISLSALEKLPRETKAIAVVNGAVITPAAADWLRSKGIQVERTNPAAAAIAASSSPTTAGAVQAGIGWVADSDSPSAVEGYARQLRLRSLAVNSVETAQHGIASSMPGVVFSRLPALDVDRLARQQGCCAVAVDSLEAVQRIAAAMQPMVWVIDSERLSYQGRITVAAQCLRIASVSGGKR